MIKEDLKTFFTKHKIVIFSIITGLCFLLSIIFYIRYIIISTARDNQILNARVDTMVKYKLKNGDIGYKITERVVENTKQRDSLAKELLIAKGELEKYIKISTQSDYSSVKGKVKDSVSKDANGKDKLTKYASFEDGYISINASMDDSLRFTKLETRDTLSAVFQKHKEGGVTINNLIVTNKSPYGKITGLDNISYKEQPEYRRWSLGAHIGYSFITKQPDASVGINYDLFRFKK